MIYRWLSFRGIGGTGICNPIFYTIASLCLCRNTPFMVLCVARLCIRFDPTQCTRHHVTTISNTFTNRRAGNIVWLTISPEVLNRRFWKSKCKPYASSSKETSCFSRLPYPARMISDSLGAENERKRINEKCARDIWTRYLKIPAEKLFPTHPKPLQKSFFSQPPVF